jgi:putative isomerase
MVFRGLVKYGFEDDARTLAEKTILLFARDLEVNGCLHEFYNPDTGEPIMTKNFQNWNFLVLNMIAYVEGRPVVAEF